MCGRSGSAPPSATSGAAVSVLLALAAGADADESDRLRRVGRSGSPAGGLLEAGELVDPEDGLVEPEDESVDGELPLESRSLKWGRLFPASAATWGMFLPCFGFAFLGGGAMGFHEPYPNQ